MDEYLTAISSAFMQEITSVLLHPSFLPWIILGLAVIVFIGILWLIYLSVRMSRFFHAGKPDKLDTTLSELMRAAEIFDKRTQEHQTRLVELEHKLPETISGIGIVRFNPFKGTGTGGNQSFAVAFLNEYGSGVVFSSLYTRERVNVYAKDVVEYKSSYELTAEEQEAIGKARESH